MTKPEGESNPNTFSNENVCVSVSRQPNCHVKFELQVDPKATEAAYVQAIKNIRKEVSIPGFRKGKVPEKLVLEKYKKPIEREFTDVVLNTGFQEAIKLTGISPFKEGTIKPHIQECSKEKGAKFTIDFETPPQIPSIDLSHLQVSFVSPTPITEEHIKNTLKQVATQFATYDPIEGRPVQEGDYVDIDVDLLEERGPKRVINQQRTEVSPEGLPIWILNKVIGLNKGESVEGPVESQPQAENNNPPATFRATINAIWKVNFPSFDDELAKKAGEESFDKLKANIQKRLESQAQEEAAQIEMQQLEKFLIETYPVDLPGSLLDKVFKANLKGYVDSMQNPQEYQYYQSNKAEIERTIRMNTKSRIGLDFLLRKLSLDHNIGVTPEEISQEFNHQIMLLSSGRSHMDFSDKDRLFEQLRAAAFQRKIMQFLLDKAGKPKD